MVKPKISTRGACKSEADHCSYEDYLSAANDSYERSTTDAQTSALTGTSEPVWPPSGTVKDAGIIWEKEDSDTTAVEWKQKTRFKVGDLVKATKKAVYFKVQKALSSPKIDDAGLLVFREKSSSDNSSDVLGFMSTSSMATAESHTKL